MSVTWDPPPVNAEQDVQPLMGPDRGEMPAVGPPDGQGASLTAADEWLAVMRPRLVRLARRFVWNEHDAEEIAQDALVLAWQKTGRLRNADRRDAWTYRCTVNLAMNRLRRRRLRPMPEGDSLAASTDVDGEDLQTGELARRVRTAMTGLPARQQAALILREMEGMAYEEVAAILGTRSATARLLVHRARESLRQTLLRQSPDSFGPDR